MKIVDYDESIGEVEFPEGFEEKLAGKTIEEQMDRYRITESVTFARTAYGELTNEDIMGPFVYKLPEYEHCTGLIVRDGQLVGVLMKSALSGNEVRCLPGWKACTYYASDNNGAGYKERYDYAYLICV